MEEVKEVSNASKQESSIHEVLSPRSLPSVVTFNKNFTKISSPSVRDLHKSSTLSVVKECKCKGSPILIVDDNIFN